MWFRIVLWVGWTKWFIFELKLSYCWTLWYWLAYQTHHSHGWNGYSLANTDLYQLTFWPMILTIVLKGSRCTKAHLRHRLQWSEAHHNLHIFFLYFSSIFPLFFLYFPSIFPHLLRFLHFSTIRLRLGQNLGELFGWKQPEKGVGKEDRAKTTLFWPVFYFKGTSSKTTSFGPKKSKKKLGLLCPLQPDVEEEEKKKKKKKKKKKEEEEEEEEEEKEVGDRGALVNYIVPCRRRAPLWRGVVCLQARRRRVASRCPEPRCAFHNYD